MFLYFCIFMFIVTSLLTCCTQLWYNCANFVMSILCDSNLKSNKNNVIIIIKAAWFTRRGGFTPSSPKWQISCQKSYVTLTFKRPSLHTVWQMANYLAFYQREGKHASSSYKHIRLTDNLVPSFFSISRGTTELSV